MKVNIANENIIQKEFANLNDGDVFKINKDDNLYLVTSVGDYIGFNLNQSCEAYFAPSQLCTLYDATIEAKKASKSTT